MLTVASLLWDPNERSMRFSRCYDEVWVERLYAGFAENLTIPWRFVLFTDRLRDLNPHIKQEMMRSHKPGYADCIEPFRYGCPMILVGLDTVITGSIDHLGSYCLEKETLALPKDPYNKERSCNGVCLIPEGHQYIYRNWNGQNDMEWLRLQKHEYIDNLFPGQVLSYKGDIRKNGNALPDNARIVYFHGDEKPHELMELPWIKRHWLHQT